MPAMPAANKRRSELTRTISQDTLSCLSTIHKTYFGPDSTSDAVQIQVEAFGNALIEWARTKPQGRAIMLTFVRELQDSLDN